MAILQFSKFSPGGNDTVFLHSPPREASVASAALGLFGGEQAGFVDINAKSLVMAGGEFCINASRAFGALLDLARQEQADPALLKTPVRRYKIAVSGWNTKIDLDVSGEMPNWQISAKLALSECAIEILDSRHTLVRLPGISHLLCFGEMPSIYMERHLFIEEAERKRRHFGLENEEALGIIGCQTDGNRNFDITPYVIVPAVGTAMIESCCGSASLALGLYSHKIGHAGQLRISQPKSSLNVLIEKTESGLFARIGGPVEFMARGEINTSFLFK